MTLFEQPLILPLGWTLLHFLWQGAAIAILLAGADAALRKAGPNVRYALACGALVLMLLSAAATFLWLRSESASAGIAPAAPAVSASVVAASQLPATPDASGIDVRLIEYLPWLVAAWLAGVLALSVRSLAGWLLAQRLKTRGAEPVDPPWQQRLNRLARALAISRPVRLSKSALAEVPAVVGWLRPVVLVPAGAFIALDARHLEALLAHELAHIRRHDYLVNLLQTAAETLLFYHPAVWWVGQRIRIERENCCDDLAVFACGDVATYARALTGLEELRNGRSRFAMAADGGDLLARIRRLVAAGQPAGHGAKSWLAAPLALIALAGVWAGAHVASPTAAAASATLAAQAAERDPAPVPDPAPAQAPAPAHAGKSFIGDLAAAGYPSLTPDQLIALKIHNVTPAYIRELRDAGLTNLTPDNLVALRIHGVDPKHVAEFQSAGFGKLNSDQLVTVRIHGVTPALAAEMKSLGLGSITLDQLVAFRIHNVTPDFVRGLNAAGLSNLTADNAVAARIHGITPAFIEEARKRGFKNLTFDQLLRLKIAGVLPAEIIV